ncbi:hypothetical protein [Planobispora rosea]|uniref:hypothetical protein n=1 Tax=Planobispora rosea TaxID=35762 RepID=UPI0016712A76|nr:hypothetical protein [Planobispora rosea]
MHQATGEWTLIGAHHQAGTSTLAALLNHRQSGFAVEFAAGTLPAKRVVIVARSTPDGAEAAAAMVTDWPLPTRPVLCLVADVPFPASRLTRHRIKVISPRLSAVIGLPYLFALRNLGSVAAAVRHDRKTTHAARGLQRALARLALSEDTSS